MLISCILTSETGIRVLTRKPSPGEFFQLVTACWDRRVSVVQGLPGTSPLKRARGIPKNYPGRWAEYDFFLFFIHGTLAPSCQGHSSLFYPWLASCFRLNIYWLLNIIYFLFSLSSVPPSAQPAYKLQSLINLFQTKKVSDLFHVFSGRWRQVAGENDKSQSATKTVYPK